MSKVLLRRTKEVEVSLEQLGVQVYQLLKLDNGSGPVGVIKANIGVPVDGDHVRLATIHLAVWPSKFEGKDNWVVRNFGTREYVDRNGETQKDHAVSLAPSLTRLLLEKWAAEAKTPADYRDARDKAKAAADEVAEEGQEG